MGGSLDLLRHLLRGDDEKLTTLPQFEYYLTRALEEAYKVGKKPVGADMIETVLANYQISRAAPARL